MKELSRLDKSQKELMANHKALLKGLPDCKDVFLSFSSPKKRSNEYYYRVTGDGKKKYLGTVTDQHVQDIMQSKYLSESISRLENNIALIERFVQDYKTTEFDDILNSMPKTYRGLERVPAAAIVNTAEQWLEKNNSIKSHHPTKYPESLRIKTIDGTMVRSKSEALIANVLATQNIPYIYELPTFVGEQIIYVDFTCLSTSDYKTEIRIEHQGMIGDAVYEANFLRKLHAFLEGGFTPSQNIFFTFDDLKGGFDVSVIQNIIDYFLR